MKKSVVLIEDDKKTREQITEILELSNFIVFVAENEKNGVVLAKTIIPNLIICSVSKAKLNHLEVFEMIKQSSHLQDVPFLFLTTKHNLNNKDLINLIQVETNQYLLKPFSKAQLLEAVESRLKKSINTQLLNKTKSSIENYWKSRNTSILIEKFLKNKTIYRYKKDATIYCQGNLSHHIFYIKKGEVKTYKVNELGKEFITGYFKKNECFGYSSFIIHEPHFENSKAISNVQLYKISKKELVELIANYPTLLYEIINLLAHDLIHLKEQLLRLAYGSVRRKTAATLLQLANEFNKKGDGEINMSKINLAHSIGIEYETLIRTLHDFKEEKLITENEKGLKLISEKKLLKVL
ncbi:MAG: cyclic nucleotide-binding domain-containing protein [Lutibacter sp.]|uniref:cyclic nucleotide-binding domain-containing protein n=1 Tax=Lutibacter sp. TaxID=1925666 RepID=UPI001811A20F|nr:cyclic nucleotide-binding domain-containing protein [Lutibacter sp.]MBT8317855.1 cyclic nucleotide-binding domain-containing protein [Lutibacter sp.]NNJ58713.1 cyclic nucleotide-binding domain-containing protein [Lutibacter sp.]